MEDSFVKIDVDTNIKISPCVIIDQLSDDFGDFLSFEEDALRNAGVLDFGLCDVDGLVGEVVVNDHFSDSVVL